MHPSPTLLLGVLSLTSLGEPAPRAGDQNAAQEPATDPAPVADPLELIGLHLGHPLVDVTLRWMSSDAEARTEDGVQGRGLFVGFDHDRVDYVELRLHGGDPEYQGPIPAGLTRETEQADLVGTADWRRSSARDVLGYTRPMSRNIAGSEIGGIHLYANFHPETKIFKGLAAKTDMSGYWLQLCDAVQKALPTGSVTSAQWFDTLGEDIAGDDGTVIAALLGVRLGASEATRNRITLVLDDARTVESFTFHPGFLGQVPLGLTLPTDPAPLLEAWGPADALEGGRHRWTLPWPDQPPLVVDVGTTREDASLRIAMPGADRRRWIELMGATGAPDPELLDSVRDVWDVLRTDASRLKGRAETFEGLLGPQTFWHTRSLLSGVLGGRLLLDDSFPLFQTYKAEYAVRRVYGTDVDAAAALAPFRAPLSELLGEEWTVAETATDGRTALVWGTEETDDFAAPSTVTLRTRLLEAEGGLDVVLELVVPVP